MIRVTFEIVPKGIESAKRTIGKMEVWNVGCTKDGLYSYGVLLKKTPPFDGALYRDWRRGMLTTDIDVEAADVEGFHRTKRGVYDLVYRALKACGLEQRSKDGS